MGEEGGRGGRGRGGKPCLPVVKRFVSVLGEVENFSNADNKVNLIVSGDLIRRHAVRRTTERNGWVGRGGVVNTHTHTHVHGEGGREKLPNDATSHQLMTVAFSLRARILGEWSTTHSPTARSFSVEISSLKLIPLFRSGSAHSGCAS